MLLLVAAAIVYGSLYPWRFDFDRVHEFPLWILLHSWPRLWNRFIWRDAVFNIIIYAPFGAAACRSLAQGIRPAAAVLAATGLATALSASMEILQLYVPGRTCSLLDVLCNLTGAAAGALAVVIWRTEIDRRLGGGSRAAAPRRRRTAAVLLLACWAASQWYPFFPALGRTSLRASIAVLLQRRQFQPLEIWANAAEWFTVALLVETCFPSLGEGWMAVVMASLLGRLLIYRRVLTPEEVAGAAAALWLWLASRRERRLSIATGILAVAILLRELSPFRFVRSPAPFGWVPFVASMTADRQAALIVLCRKVFDYGAMIWLLSRRGVPYRIAGPAVAVVLLICEWLQRYLPGRTPETTDVVLALLLAAILPALTRR